jgi:flagellar secretion chaperone FliS
MTNCHPTTSRDSYLESKVLTAPPHRLHLMLIEGALRFTRQADELLARGDQSAASTALLRVVDIVVELRTGVRERGSDLNQKLADLYLFLFRRASEAKINADRAALADVQRLLEFERQTWQQVCDKFADAGQFPHPAGLSIQA